MKTINKNSFHLTHERFIEQWGYAPLGLHCVFLVGCIADTLNTRPMNQIIFNCNFVINSNPNQMPKFLTYPRLAVFPEEAYLQFIPLIISMINNSLFFTKIYFCKTTLILGGEVGDKCAQLEPKSCLAFALRWPFLKF